MAKKQNALLLMIIGGILCIAGLPTWFFLAELIDALTPPAEWAKKLILFSLFLPILFGCAYLYGKGNARGIGWLMGGWLLTLLILCGIAAGGLYIGSMARGG